MKPIKIFADEASADPKAMNQFYEAMSQDFAVAGAVMPDIHLGYSLPIGSVVATKDVIVPSWVGYDIGCGVLAGKLDIEPEAIMGNRDDIFNWIVETVPIGNSMRGKLSPVSLGLPKPSNSVGLQQFEKRNARLQLGTLGGGNHFIEIGADERDSVWVIIHSGSRGVGHGIAGEYMKLASGSDNPKEGHYGFAVKSYAGASYIADMGWALSYALLNREVMLDSVMTAISKVTGDSLTRIQTINRNHNHAVKKDGLWIHRKGATHAEDGMMGVIPGNMRDGSFIVCGKGNPDSLWSSSHGAGRIMGRGQAKRELFLPDFEKTMGDIKANISANTIDESPMAYKSIYEVMKAQSELVDIVAHVKPILNVKG